MQYICLVATIAVPILAGSYFSQEIRQFIPGLACIFLIVLAVMITAAMVITEIICVKKVKSAEDTQKLFKVWKRLKFCTIPFYIISFAAYIILAPITFPVSVVFVPLDALLGEIMIIISGSAGVRSIKEIKKTDRHISPVNYVFQFLPVLDVLSTLALKKKTK